MKVIVCGGRDFSNVAFIWRELDRMHESNPITELMHGGASGADAIARDWAVGRGVRRWVCKAEWEKYGKSAGPIRNQRMLDWSPDVVVAFPGGRGTANMVKLAEGRRVRVHLVK